MTGLRSILGRAHETTLERLDRRLRPDANSDFEPEFLALYERCRSYTMTSIERMYGLYSAVNHVCRERIPGDFVECGVWRGGSSMLAGLVLARLGESDRRLHLYDTFAGMSEPTTTDGSEARREWVAGQAMDHNEWCYASLDEVRGNLLAAGVQQKNVSFVQGKVEDTIPAVLPAQVSILRLDTDWYESTLHELTHLYPLLSSGGVLIIDDYGHWEGARTAVDKYFDNLGHRPLLARLDYTGRMCVKP